MTSTSQDSLSELKPWAERIEAIARHAEVIFVITNNHYQGKAIANGLQLISLLRGQSVRVPETLLDRYPELRNIAIAGALPSEPQQSDFSFETSPAE